jgi:transposase
VTSDTSEISRQRRRRYDAAFKRAIVEQTLAPGTSVARIAREHGINANQLFTWRRQFLLAEGDASAPTARTPPAISLLPVTLLADEPAPVTAPTSVGAAEPGQIEIALTGATVRIQGTVDPAMLRLVLSSLRR